MRKTPILVASLFLTGSFVVAQGCGGSTTEDAIGPTVAGAGSAGKAGASAGSGGSTGGTAQGGSTQGGTSGSTSGGASQGGSGGTTSGGGKGGSTSGGGKGGSTSGGSGGVDLFDASIPDADLGDGQTAAGCYDCTKVECKMELDACAQDPKCGTAAACVLTDCLDNPGIQCVGSCGFQAGISSLNDPAIGLVTAVAQCTSQKCPNDCPSFNLPGGGGAGGMGQGGSTSTGGSGGAAQGGATGTGGFSSSTCQMNIQACGQSCISPGLACFQDSTCQKCLQALQGGNPPDAACSSNAAFKGMIDCACANPAKCAGCCPQ